MIKNQRAFSLIEIVIVIAIIGLLVAVTIISFKPHEIFANGRNSKRVTDIQALNTSLGQWLSREGVEEIDPYDTLELMGTGVLALTPNDGSIADEGVDATSVSQLALPAYLQIIPKDPDGSEYRVGVDSLENPNHVLVCTDKIEHTTTYPASDYPNNIFCLSN
jgi:prepilin-type N-terminal cleavage/methylation domain-containing protein